jgi:hypothetical protein
MPKASVFRGEIMRVQIFCGLFLLSFLVLFQAVAAQEQQSENFYIAGTTKPAIYDRFSTLPECDLRGRLDNFLVTLRDNPGAKGYIIFYRGVDELPGQQTDAFAERVLNLYANHVRLRRFPQERVILIDGGFRSSRMTELWFTPPGGEAPQPSETVEKPVPEKNKALLIESSYLDLAGAEIPEPEELSEETEIREEIVETQETDAELTDNQDGEETEPEELFGWTSGYFAKALKEDKSARGRVIFYADETTYDLAKAREIVESGMSDLAKKAEVNLSRVKIVFGGYRELPEIEFWIIPRGSKKPKPTPQQRKVTEEIKTEN